MLMYFPCLARRPTIIPNGIFHSRNEFLRYAAKRNGTRDFLLPLYQYRRTKCCNSPFSRDFVCLKCGRPVLNEEGGLNPASLQIDCAAFDIDLKQFSSREEMCQVVQNFVQGFSGTVYLNCSGVGFHAYVSVTCPNQIEGTELTESQKRYLLRNFQSRIDREFDLRSDPQIIGDIRRNMRVPGTINMKHRLYCYNIRRLEQISREFSGIPPVSFRPLKIGPSIDISANITTIPEEQVQQYTTFSIEIESSGTIIDILQANGVVLEDIPPCIQLLMQNPEMGWEERYLFIRYLRDLFFTQETAEQLLQQILSPQKFRHCVRTEHQVRNAFERHLGFRVNCRYIRSILKRNCVCSCENRIGSLN